MARRATGLDAVDDSSVTVRDRPVEHCWRDRGERYYVVGVRLRLYDEPPLAVKDVGSPIAERGPTLDLVWEGRDVPSTQLGFETADVSPGLVSSNR